MSKWEEFELAAAASMGKHFSRRLEPGYVSGVPKRFDLVSEDGSIAGDAKCFSSVNGISDPSAKRSNIAEHVWLLEKTDAQKKFLVFGNDRRVPARWLAKYGSLVQSVQFYFLDEEGRLEGLN